MATIENFFVKCSRGYFTIYLIQFFMKSEYSEEDITRFFISCYASKII